MKSLGIIGIFVTTLWALVVVSCKTNASMARQIDEVLLYELERTGCLGDCPVFRLQVYASRKMTIFPHRGIAVTSTTSDTLSDDEFAALRVSMAMIQSAALDSLYDNQVVDAPFTIIRIKNEDIFQVIKCRGDAPEVLDTGLQVFENLARKRDWLQHPKAATKSAKKELIMELENAADTSRLIQKYGDYQLEFIKRISPRQAFFLFSSSVSENESEELLKLLHKDPLILQVQWNHQLKKRDE